MSNINKLVGKYIGINEEEGENLATKIMNMVKKFIKKDGKKKNEDILNEKNSTVKLAETIMAIAEFYMKKFDKTKPTEKEIEVMNWLQGVMEFMEENGSATPEQAKGVYNISQGIKKMTGK